jgi:uncharacterized protein YggE
MRRHLAGALLAFAFAAACPLAASAQEGEARQTVSVTGTADVLVVPDEVVLSLGVETRDRALAVAKTRHDEIMARALAVAKRHGVEAQNVKTDYISIEPSYEGRSADFSYRLEGFTVKKNLVILLKDTTKFETLLTEVLEAGVNHVHGVEFRTSELRKHRDRARALAVAAAREKAAALAKELDRTAGRAVSIDEAGYGYYSLNSNVSQNSSSGGGSSQEGVAFALGQIRVSASVNVRFELK